MRFFAKLLRYIAQWLVIVSWAWDTRKTATYYHNADGTTKKQVKGFFAGYRMARRSCLTSWKDA